MSADGRVWCKSLGLSICWGLLGTAGASLAQEDDQPDLEFLEYLGSWEASDEDWMMLAEAEESQEESTDKEESDPSPDGEKLAELDDES